MSPSALDLLTLLGLPGIGPRGAVRLAQTSIDEEQRSEKWPDARSDAERIFDDCAGLGVGVTGWFDADFPERLREIPDPPAVLYYRGNIAAAQHLESAAVVGTREPSQWGADSTHAITRSLAAKGWTIVSGLAVGIDTIAHRAALDANAPTVAVLGNGLATVYPARNRALAYEIVEAGGLLLSEIPPRRKVEPRALVKRDRLQSGLAAATIISQGGVASGAMHTARYAYEQGRPLFCVTIDRGAEPIGEQDAGTRTLLEEPALRLPELLPAWKRVSARRLTAEPAARPLDEAGASELTAFGDEAGSPQLF